MFQIIRELVFELITPNRHSSGSVTQRITRLDHKLRNDTMEQYTLVISTPCMSDKVLDCLWRLLREESQVHVANGSVDCGSIGDRRGATLARSCCGSGNGLLFSCRTLVENISVPGLVVSVQLLALCGCEFGRNMYSGSERVNM